MIAEYNTIFLEHLNEKGPRFVIHLSGKIVKGLTDRTWEKECQHLSDAFVVEQSIRHGQLLGHEHSNFFNIALIGPMLIKLLIIELVKL